MIKQIRVISLSMFATALLSPALNAQQDAAVLDQVRQCAQIADSAARYTCYDRATSAAGMRPGSNATQGTSPGGNVTQSRIPATRPAPPPAPAPETATAVQPSPQGAPFDPPAVAASKQERADATANNYRDKITELREREPGRFLITLASGQQWLQVESKRYRMRTGQDVRIYPGLFSGSWRMSADGINGFIQVERIK